MSSGERVCDSVVKGTGISLDKHGFCEPIYESLRDPGKLGFGGGCQRGGPGKKGEAFAAGPLNTRLEAWSG